MIEYMEIRSPEDPAVREDLMRYLGGKGISYNIASRPEACQVSLPINAQDFTEYEESNGWKKGVGHRSWAQLTTAYSTGKLSGLRFGIDAYSDDFNCPKLKRATHLGDLDLGSLVTTFKRDKRLADNNKGLGRRIQFGPNFMTANILFLETYVHSPEVRRALRSATPTE